MPVGAYAMSKRPLDSVQVQPANDHRIFIHVRVVVVVDELVMQRLAEDHPDNRRQKNADPENQPAGVLHCRCFNGQRSGRTRWLGSGFFAYTYAHGWGAAGTSFAAASWYGWWA